MPYTTYNNSTPTPTPTPTPTINKRSFDSTLTGLVSNNFGLSRNSLTSGGSPNVYGTAVSLGTLTAAVDGLEITVITNTAIMGALNIYADGARIVTAWGFNPSDHLTSRFEIPIRIASGKNITVEMASTGAGNGAVVAAKAWQSEVQEVITSWAALGSSAAMTTQGVSFGAGSTPDTWQTIGTLAADAKAFSFMPSYANDASRTGSNEYIIDIGKGASGSETILYPKMKAKDTTTVFRFAGCGTYRADVANGTRIAAKVNTVGGTLPDAVAVQAMVGY